MIWRRMRLVDASSFVFWVTERDSFLIISDAVLFFIFAASSERHPLMIIYFLKGARPCTSLTLCVENTFFWCEVAVRAPNKRSEVSGWACCQNGGERRSVACGDHIEIGCRSKASASMCYPPLCPFPPNLASTWVTLFYARLVLIVTGSIK